MNTWPAITDALQAEWRPDNDRGHSPATVVHPNGSLMCVSDYELCGVLAREVVTQWFS